MVDDVMLREVLSQLTGHDLPAIPREAREERLLGAVQSPTENPRLEFRDGQFFLHMTTPAGALVERYLAASSVREAFSGIPIDSGWLPPEIVRWGDGQAGEWAVAFFAPAVHELEITNEEVREQRSEGEEVRDSEQPLIAGGTPAVPGEPTDLRPPTSDLQRLRVPLPGLVFFGRRRPIARSDFEQASDTSATNYFIFAVKTEKLDPFQEIYGAPLPNVYADGRVCWGLVKPPRPTSRSLIQAFELFIKSTFNNHLANGKSKREKDDVRVMLRELAGKEQSAECEILATVACGACGELNSIYPADLATPLALGSLPGYPLDDLVRQVANVGVTLDKAIREFMETGVMAE